MRGDGFNRQVFRAYQPLSVGVDSETAEDVNDTYELCGRGSCSVRDAVLVSDLSC